MRVPVTVGMRVCTRKAHPCGSSEWTVFRIGADIGIACAGCGRRLMLERELFVRRIKYIIEAPAQEPLSQEDSE